MKKFNLWIYSGDQEAREEFYDDFLELLVAAARAERLMKCGDRPPLPGYHAGEFLQGATGYPLLPAYRGKRVTPGKARAYLEKINAGYPVMRGTIPDPFGEGSSFLHDWAVLLRAWIRYQGGRRKQPDASL